MSDEELIRRAERIGLRIKVVKMPVENGHKNNEAQTAQKRSIMNESPSPEQQSPEKAATLLKPQRSFSATATATAPQPIELAITISPPPPQAMGAVLLETAAKAAVSTTVALAVTGIFGGLYSLLFKSSDDELDDDES